MTNAFTAMIAAVYADPNMAVDAVYKPVTGAIKDIRVLKRWGESQRPMLSGAIYAESLLLTVQRADIALPVRDDLIALGIKSDDPALATPNFWTSYAQLRRVTGATESKSGNEWKLDTEPAQ